MDRKLKSSFGSAFDKRKRADRQFTGFVGRNDGVVRVPNRANYLYVRLWDGSIVEAFNNSVPAQAGLPVKITYRSRRYWIDDIARDVFQDPVFIIPDGIQDALQWPNSNTLYVRGEQFLPGLVAGIGGMVVRIFPCDEYPGEDVDLTAHIPATGARWVLVEVNDTAANIVDGTITTLDLLPATAKPARTAGYVQKAAVRLYAGQTALAYNAAASDIIDKRWDSITDLLPGDITGLYPITLAQMDNLAQSTVIGRAVGAGTGISQALTAAQAAAIVAGAGVFAQLATSNTFTQPNPLITPAESWIGPSALTGVYFKGTFVGLGTNNPLVPLHIVRNLDTGAILQSLGATNVAYFSLRNAAATGLGVWNVEVGRNSPYDYLGFYNGTNQDVVRIMPTGEMQVGRTVTARYDAVYPTTGAGYYQLATNNTTPTDGGLTTYFLKAGVLTQGLALTQLHFQSAVPIVIADGIPTEISTRYGANSDGYNIWMGGGGSLAHGTIGSTYQGSYNVAIGVASMLNSTLAYYNVALGAYSLYNNTSGSTNVALGVFALFANTIGFHNIGIGTSALQNNTVGTENTGIGANALIYNVNGGYNVGIGSNALFNSVTGNYNIAIGFNALYNSLGDANTAIGQTALLNLTTGHDNTGIGANAGNGIVGGGVNQTGTGGVFVGENTIALNDGDSNEVVIGTNAVGTGSDTTVIGNSSTTKTTLKGYTVTTGRKQNVTKHSASYTILESDEVVVFTATANITFPAASTVLGMTVRVVCRAGTLTFVRQGSDTFKGSATVILNPGEDMILTATEANIWE